MRVFERIRRNPVTVLVALVMGLAAWIAAEQVPSPSPPSVHVDRIHVERVQGDPFALPADQPVAVEMLPNLRPGMTRMEVEKVSGAQSDAPLPRDRFEAE